MGTEGAACATIFSQGISFVISVFHLKRKDSVFDFRLSLLFYKTDKLAAILKVGLPTAVQMASVNLSYLLITGMLNQFGVSVAAASGVGLKINTFAGMPCWAIGQAVTAMAGQNMGAGNIKTRAKTTSTGLLPKSSYYTYYGFTGTDFWKAAHSPVYPGKPGSALRKESCI